jgi:alpha-tubulin suppressor-like RCC1 family protein
MSEDYALVRYKNIAPGFDPAESSNLIVDAVKDMVLDANSIGHHWQWLDSQADDHLYRSVEPVSGSVHQFLKIRSHEGTVKLAYFSTDATVEDFTDYNLIDPASQLLDDYDLRGTSEFYDFNDLAADSLDGTFNYDVSPPISLDSTKQHRVWLAEYRESNANSCATENACALTILVEEITDEETNDARFVLGAHVGSVITPVNANERLARLSSAVADSTDSPYLYALSTDAALVGVPSNPNRLPPEVPIEAEVDPSWLGQSTAIDGSWVQSGPTRESLAAIGHGSHLSDSYMLSTNGRAKLLPLTTYAKQDRLEETPVETKWTQISTSVNGYHTLAVDEFGRAWAWGENFYGQLGIGTSNDGTNGIFDISIDTNIPAMVSIPSGHPGTWIQISAGGEHSLGIDSNGKGWAWGRNDSGQLGVNDSNLRDIPTEIDTSDVNIWKQLSAGDSHSLGIASDDTAWAWGENSRKTLGDNSTTDRLIPVEVRVDLSVPSGHPGTWKQVSAGSIHSLGIDINDKAWSWGSNSQGRLGINDSDVTTVNTKGFPVAIDTQTPRPQTYKQLSAGTSHSLSIASDDAAWAWGSNLSGRLGVSTTDFTTYIAPSPVIIGGLNNAPQTYKQLSAGDSHSLGIASDDTAWAWGSDSNGQLGNNVTGNQVIPYAVDTTNDRPLTWLQLSAGLNTSLSISADSQNYGKLWAWGRNIVGQLGDGTLDNKTLPSISNLPGPYFILLHKPLSTELGRTRYVRQLGIEPLEHGAIFVSSTPSSQQAWKALGNGSNQITLWSTTAVEVA